MPVNKGNTRPCEEEEFGFGPEFDEASVMESSALPARRGSSLKLRNERGARGSFGIVGVGVGVGAASLASSPSSSSSAAAAAAAAAAAGAVSNQKRAYRPAGKSASDRMFDENRSHHYSVRMLRGNKGLASKEQQAADVAQVTDDPSARAAFAQRVARAARLNAETVSRC